MRILETIIEEMRSRDRGLAAHYLFLYSVVRGLDAQLILEFGAGMSTRVILAALDDVNDLGDGIGTLVSCSTDAAADVARAAGFGWQHRRWAHHQGLSTNHRDRFAMFPPVDLILHDGAHDYGTVRDDLVAVLPRLRRFGIALVHDTQHEHHGPALLYAIRDVQSDLLDVARFSSVTLPYGYGLTILRREDGPDPVVGRAFDKLTSAFATVPA